MTTGHRTRWESLRYGTLLPSTARSRLAGDVYARLCAAVESRLDPGRRAGSVARMQRWLGVDAPRADAIFMGTLRSEAQEEADVSWYMHHPAALADAFRMPTPEPPGGPAIWATFHLGSPNLAFVGLRRRCGIDLRIIARPLDDSNPMPASKRAWGRRKVAWLERATDTQFLDTSAEALSIARSRLLKGGSLFVLIDVPGDIVARSVTVSLCGERVRIAAGMFVLAGITGVPLRPVVAVRGAHHIELHYGDAITPVGKQLPIDAVERAIEATVRRWPNEWWLWPYLPPAP